MGDAAGRGGGRVLVLVNAASGQGIDEATRIHLREHAPARLRGTGIVVIDEPELARLRERAAAELARGAAALVVIGGDGMVSLGVDLVAGTPVPLGILPAGSGNDFARAAGIPTARRRWREALDRLLRALEHPDAYVRRVDALRVRCGGRERWVANSVNFGFDAVVNARANELRLPGTLRYLAAIVQEAGRFEAREFGVRLDDGPAERLATTLVCAANGGSIGGGVRIAPRADLADGRVEVVTVAALPKLGFLALFPTAMLGMHVHLPQVCIRRAARLEVTGPPELPVFTDGEPIGAGGFELEVVPGAWRLLRG